MMRKVKPETVGADIRAGLLDMIAERHAQSFVQEVGSRVIAHDIPAAGRIDGGSDALILLQYLEWSRGQVTNVIVVSVMDTQVIDCH